MRICYVRYHYQEDVHEDLLCACGFVMCDIFIRGMCMRICYVHVDLLFAISLSGGCA